MDNEYKFKVWYLARLLKQEDPTLPWFLAVRTANAKLQQLNQAKALGFL